MRTLRLALAGTVILALLGGLGGVVVAQYEEHPAVGGWVNNQAPDDPGNPPALTTFHADGTVRDWTVNDGGVGVWEPTGERGLASTMLYPLVDPEAGFVGVNTVRIIGEVSEDGQTVSGTYTVEFPTGPEGAFPPPGQYGPAEWIATRILVEPQGEPVGPWPLPPPPEE